MGDTQWFFRDKDQVPQGPFTAQQMRSWIEYGYLSIHVAIALQKEGPYAKLCSFFPNKSSAFLAEPEEPGEEEWLDLENNDIWCFKDTFGAIQGPFNGNQMRSWARAGYFKGSLQVRKGMGPEAAFVPLDTLFPDMSTAFGRGNGSVSGDATMESGRSTPSNSPRKSPSKASMFARANRIKQYQSGEWARLKRSPANSRGGTSTPIFALDDNDTEDSGDDFPPQLQDRRYTEVSRAVSTDTEGGEDVQRKRVQSAFTKPVAREASQEDGGSEHIASLIHTLQGALEKTEYLSLESKDDRGTRDGNKGRWKLDEQKEILRLCSTIALLQDENGSLKSEVRGLMTFMKEHYPEALKHEAFPVKQPRAHETFQRLHGDSNGEVPGSGGELGKDSTDDEMRKIKQRRKRQESCEDEEEGEAALFDKYVVVEYIEDSPMLRRNMLKFESGIDRLRNDLKVLIKGADTYYDAGMQHTYGITDLAKGLEQQEITTLAPLMHELGQVLKRISQLKETLLVSLKFDFITPLEDFVKNDVKQAQHMRRELHRTRETYETLEAKFMQHFRRPKGRSVGGVIGRGRDTAEEELYAELEAARARFELARFGLIQQLNQLEAKKRFTLLDRGATGMALFLDYFREGYTLLASHAPMIEAIRDSIAKAQAGFDISVQKWNEKRIQLESQLHSGAFPFRSKERRKLKKSIVHEKVTVQSSSHFHDPSIIHEGYLYKKSSSVRKDWKRRWFVLRKNELLYYRGWKDLVAHPVCDMLLCTVRQVKNPEMRHCFEIISPNKRAYMLQALDENDLKTWMDAIRQAISSQLTTQEQRPSLSRSSGKSDPEIGLLLALNSTCADCGAKDPDWVSLNLCVVICITCSGIHRSLGTHVSKVRSVSLDRLPRTQLQLLRRVGNVKVNSIWEKNLASNVKPLPSAPQSEKQQYITQKYVDRAFCSTETVADVEKAFLTAVENDDIDTVLTCVSKQVNMNAVTETGDGCLHIAVQNKSQEMCEYLVLNGADVDLVSALNQTALQVAVQLEHEEVAEILEKNTSKYTCSVDTRQTSSSFTQEPRGSRTPRIRGVKLGGKSSSPRAKRRPTSPSDPVGT